MHQFDKLSPKLFIIFVSNIYVYLSLFAVYISADGTLQVNGDATATFASTIDTSMFQDDGASTQLHIEPTVIEPEETATLDTAAFVPE